jgi:arylsulfatase A-like enzyme
MNKVLSTSRGIRLIDFLLLTGFFLLLEISFFIQCNQTYLSDYLFMSHHLTIPWRIAPGILFFILAQGIIHFIYAFIIFQLTIDIAAFFKFSSAQTLRGGVSLWCIGIITLLAANQFYFPNSKFAELTMLLLGQRTAQALLLLGESILFIALSISLFANRFMRYVMLLFVLGWVMLSVKPLLLHSKDASTAAKPNIILIGIDSLRPDFVGYFGGESATPFLDHFLKEGLVLSEAVTPLARTFPSWTGILTGQYPKEVGVRTNLASRDQLDLSHALPHLLKQYQYETLYASDETRFSNIGKDYGFDHIVTPPMGLNDFLLGTFNDFPLSNLLINTSIGQWLFPYSYANRPAYFVYEPDSFLNLIRPHLLANRTKPLFLAIHFCLPHYPYLWAGLSGHTTAPIVRYQKSIERADQQLKQFFDLLQQANLLQHAIVVVLSDHGEALELPGDRITEKENFVDYPKQTWPLFYLKGLDEEGINQSVGHGTDVLGLPQYHSLLAFRLYGMPHAQQGTIAGPVSLLSIQPTILDLIQAPVQNQSDRSLISIFLNPSHNKMIAKQHIFLESDFTPDAIRTLYPALHDVVLEGVELFDIDPNTTRLTVKPSMNQMIIHSKQYADLYGHWMLAAYPRPDQSPIYILINLKNGKWTNDLHSSFAKQAPAAVMQQALEQFYGKEIKPRSLVS